MTSSNRTYDLRRLWESYIRTPQENRSRKVVNLERFIRGVLATAASLGCTEEDETRTCFPHFSDMKSVSNILAGEFLVDVQHICSTSDDDDVTQLQKYLLKGRGAILLKVLNTIGVQGLSSARELGDLLVSLLPLCCRFSASDSQLLPDVELSNIETCFEHLNHVPITQPPPKYPTVAEVTPKIKQHKLVVASYQHPNWATRVQSAGQAAAESTETESESENTQQVWPNYGMDSLYPQDVGGRLGVYPGLLQEELSSNDDAEDDLDPLGEDVKLEPLELTILLLNLSKNLCYREGIGGPQGMAVSLALLPHLSHFLLALQTDYAQGNILEGWDSDTVVYLERYTVRVIVTVASFASLQPNGISSLAASGALISLLEVAKQSLRMVAEKGLPESILGSVSSPLLTASDILLGTWLLLHTIFYCIPLNPTFLNSSLKLLSEVVENQGLRLLQTSLLVWEKHHSKQSEADKEAYFAKSHIVGLVECIGRVITSLKRAKINYIHTMRCMKKRHKTCDFKHYMHHHHDVLGIASSAMTDSQVAMNDSYGSMEALESESVNPIECSAAILADLLLKVFRDSKSRLLQVRTLCCIEESGLCCCMQPARVMRFLLKPIDIQTPGIRNYTLFVLAKSQLEYCGGSEVVQKHVLSCSICKDIPSNREDSALKISPKSANCRMQETSDSALSSSDSMHDDGPSKHPKWRCLKQYLPLINNESEDVSTQVTQHILRLVSQGSAAFKQELFYSVFLPIMKLIKEQYSCKANTTAVASTDISAEPTDIFLSEGVVQYCLSALPLLLHSRSSQDLFLNYGGLKQLCQLVQVRIFRKCVLKVFQVLIMLEDKRKLRVEAKRVSEGSLDHSFAGRVQDNADTTDSDPGHSGESASGINVVEAFMKLLLNNLVSGEATTSASLPTASLSEHTDSSAVSPSSRQDSIDSSSTISGMHSPNQFEESASTLTGSVDMENISFGTGSNSSYKCENIHLSQDKNELTVMCDVWSACASLLPYSQSFQQSFIEIDGPYIAHNLMLSCLKLICKNSKDLVERHKRANFSSGAKKLAVAIKAGDGSLLWEWLSLLESSLVICLSASKLNLFQQDQLEMAAVLQKVQEVLASSRELQGHVLKATCDTLLTCATTYRSMKDIIQNHTFAVMHLRIDDRDEVEVAELSDYCSTARDTETCHTELGYEADSEFTCDEMLNEKSSYVYRAGRSGLQLMLYPQLCKLVLHLLVDHPTEKPTSGVLSHVLLKLISLAKQSAHIASAMYNQGLVEILLNGLRKIIRNCGKSPESLVEQRLILDLFILISQHAFSSMELKLYLTLFQDENAPVDALLSTGIQLAECFKFQPEHILAFPVFKSTTVTDMELSVRSVSSDILAASIRHISRLASFDATDLKTSAQEAIDVEVIAGSSERSSSVKGPSASSPICCAPVQMHLQDKVLWPANNKGFSLSLWLRLEGLPDAEDGFISKKSRKLMKTKASGKATQSDTSTNRSEVLPTKLRMALKKNLASRHWSQQCCHIISLGNAQEQFQLWTDPNTASLLIRLIGKPLEGEELLGELCLPGLLSFENWHHLGITCTEQIVGGNTIVSIVAVSDGCYQKEGTIEHRSRADMPDLTEENHVVLGQSVPSSTPQVTVAPFQLGSLMVFQDSVLTKHTCFHLYALGPDCVTLSQCDSSNQRPGYAHHISHDALLNSGIAQEVIMGSHSIYLPKVRETMVISYSPKHPNMYNFYGQRTTHKPQRNIFGGQKQARYPFEPLCHQPVSVEVKQLADLAPQVHHGLSNAVGEIGGIGVYLFLLAKVIEQNGNQFQQAKVLKLLFSLKRQDPYHSEEFRAMNGYALLAKVFSSDRAVISMDLLKTMLDACLTKPLLRWDSIKQQYNLSPDSHPLIRDIQIITDLLLSWRVWDRAPLGVWKTAFEAIELLVSGSHASCAFNVNQLQSAAIVNRLLLICLERIQEAYPCLPVPISQSIINIIQCVVGTRPEIHVIMTMCDFLLLMHPAASTYVHHESYHFYFMQNWVNNTDTSRRSSQLSSVSSHSSVNYHLRHATTVVNIPKEYNTTSNKNGSQSHPNLVKRSKSMPLGTPPRRKKTSERFEELDTLLSDDDNSGEITGRGRSLTAPRTSPSSPRDSPRSSPQLPVNFFQGRSAGASPVPERGTTSPKPPSLRVSPVPDEDMVDKSATYIRNSITKREVVGIDDEAVEDRYAEDEDESDDDKEQSDSQKTPDEIELGEDDGKDILPKGNLSQYETMAEYLEEITGAKDMPADYVTSTLSFQVKEQIGRKNSVSEAQVRQATRKLSSNVKDVSTSQLMRENTYPSENKPQMPYIEVTEESINKEHNVNELIEDPKEVRVTESEQDQDRGEGVKGQTTMSPGSGSSDWELYLDTDTMKSIPVSLNDRKKPDELDDDESGLVLISAGLLELLSQIVVSLPSADLLQVIGIILKPEVLMILAHHAAPEIRTNVVKLLDMYIHRATVDHIETFIKQQGPQLLAAQLHRHSTCRELLEACFTILLGKPHTLEDDIDANLLSEMSKIQKLAVVPVFSLLESSVEDTSLCHNALMLLIQIFDRVHSMMQPMLENGLQETLCNVLQAVNATPPKVNDLGGDERQLLVEDVQHFFTIIAEKTFSTSGVIYHQYLEDGLTLLHALEQQQMQIYGINSEEVGHVRNIECHMFRGILDYVTTQLDTPTSRILPFTRAFSNKGGSGGKRVDLTQGELQDRLKKMISAAVDFVLYTAPQSEIVETPQARRLASLIEDNAIEIVSFEHDFARYLIDFLVKGIVAGMERSLFQRKTLNSTIMWQSKDVLRMQFSRLFVHMLHPKEVLHQRLFALDLVANEVKCRDLLKLTVHIGTTGQKLVYYLYELLSQHLNEINNPQRDEVDELMTILSSVGFQPLRLGTKLTNQHVTSMEEEKLFWDKEVLKEKKIYFRRKEGAKQRIHQKLDNTAKKLSGAAMEVTQVVSHLQNQQRKKFTEHVKMEMTHRLQIKKTWQQLIQQLTHERAVWHCRKSYPKSWQLDPTEGPSRIRKRLQRCHLGIPKKFLNDKYKDKLEAEQYDPPLSFLFEEDKSTSDSAALIYRLFTNEKIEFTCKCTSVTPSSETPGELLIGQTSVYFVGDEAIKDANYTQVLLGNKDLLSMTLPHEEIKELHKRWYQLCDNALEIFLTNGKTSLLAFTSTRERDQTFKLLDSLELPNVIRGENLAAIQNLWLEGKLTNFEYLTQLNKIAGRSFNDLMQYPVFPFVLSCYNEDCLNLEDKTIYRNLSRPIAVQHKDRERKYIENYKWLEYEKQKSLLNGDPEEYRPEPYHYGSHYSNSGTVLHFLVRLPPFTQMFLDYQDQNFDLPDRTFHNVQTAWRLASYESTTDVKELIPEFFYLPEFLLNFEGFDFGVRQTGERVWNVNLPPWCRQNARLFVLVHRQALEAGSVTSDLASWIDLVFGVKQQGKPAVDAVNVFHPATYFGVNVDAIEDPVRRTAMMTMIKTYGQTPKQLFKSPHQVKQTRQKKTSSDAIQLLQPMREVTGLKWGNYVGSPALPTPVLSWTQSFGSVVASVVSLPTGDVFGLGPCSTLLVMYSKESDAVRIHHTDVQWAAIVSWGHPDGIIRVKNKRNSPALNFMHSNSKEQVRCCASVPDCRLLFFGGTSGVLSVYHTKFNSSKDSDIQVFGHRQCLYGHSDTITMMSICKPFSIMVTASMDKTAIIWDLNRLCYVRSIQDHSAGIQALTVSDTLGDIATASHTGDGSVLMVHTINGEKIGTVNCEETIQCLAYSNAPEGKSVNVLIAGLGSGMIRFWSSWDLLLVRDITIDNFTKPIVSLTFTHDAQRLFAANVEGVVVMWEKISSAKSKPVNFIPFL